MTSWRAEGLPPRSSAPTDKQHCGRRGVCAAATWQPPALTQGAGGGKLGDAAQKELLPMGGEPSHPNHCSHPCQDEIASSLPGQSYHRNQLRGTEGLGLDPLSPK